MAQRDIEVILADVKAHLVANFNAQLLALDSEKNDGIVLRPVDSTAYHLLTLEDRVDQNDPIVLYGEADEPAIVSEGSSVAVTYRVNVWLILAEHGNMPQDEIQKRLLRYRRALVDVFRQSWASWSGSTKMKIQASLPSPAYTDHELGWTARAVGVRFELTNVTMK